MSLDPVEVQRMADTLEVQDPAAVAKLGERVEAAFTAWPSVPRPPVKELRHTFNQLFRLTTELLGSFEKLGPHERRQIDLALDLLSELPPKRYTPISLVDSVASLKRIRGTLAATKRNLPQGKAGQPKQTERWLFVMRLGWLFMEFRPRIMINGEARFELPRREHDRVEGKEIGRFRKLVFAAFAALKIDDELKGIDNVIRSVCAELGKNRHSGQRISTSDHI